jgi:hypothetical protein
MDMIRHGNENMVIADRCNAGRAAVPGGSPAGDLPARWPSEMQPEEFMVPQVAVKVWGVADAYAGEPFAQGVSDDAKSLASSLTAPYVRRQRRLRGRGLAADASRVASVALIAAARRHPIRPAFGMLVLASPDPQRFSQRHGHRFPGAHGRAGQRGAVAAASGLTAPAAAPDAHGTDAGLTSRRRLRSLGRCRPWSSAIWSMCGSKSAWPRARWSCTAGPGEADRSAACGRRGTARSAEPSHPALGGADAQRRAQRARHRADPVGLARFYRLAGARRPGSRQPGAGRARPRAARLLPKALRVDEAVQWPATTRRRTIPGWKRATRPWWSCSTAAACAWANWWAWMCRPASVPNARGRGWIDLQAAEAHVLGKGSKRRSVPVGRQALASRWRRWLAVRGAPGAEGTASEAPALFPGRHGTRSRRSRSGSVCAGAASWPGWPRRCTRTCCAIPLPATCCSPAATCAPCRNCWATPASPPRRSTPGWTSSTWPRPTTRRIRARRFVAVVPAARANPAAEPKGPVARRIGSFRDGPPCITSAGGIRRNDNTLMKTIRLKEGKERSLLRRHPWIFESAIARGGATPAKRCVWSRTRGSSWPGRRSAPVRDPGPGLEL